jgi:hypothetical protein
VSQFEFFIAYIVLIVLCHHIRMPKRPRDPNQLAKLIVDIATGEAEDTVSESKRNPFRRGALAD